MKTKLLKRIRKRFGWYYNQFGQPVLVDKLYKTCLVINAQYIQDNDYKFPEDYTKENKAWIVLKDQILKAFSSGYNVVIRKRNYRMALRNSSLSFKRHINELTSSSGLDDGTGVSGVNQG